MRPDPDYADYLSQWTKVYQNLNYGSGLSSYFLTKSHQWLEDAFSAQDFFQKVLEVGAGTGMHVQFVRHRYEQYVMTDMHPEMLEKIISVSRKMDASHISVEHQNARKLDYADASFDRLIATHVLEHLERPHEVLREWCRVIRPGGVLSLVLPCDPGVAWRVGRLFGSRPKFREVGMDYDYWMAREHVNSINNLVAMIRYYFDDLDEIWQPVRLPSMDLNLFYLCHIRIH